MWQPYVGAKAMGPMLQAAPVLMCLRYTSLVLADAREAPFWNGAGGGHFWAGDGWAGSQVSLNKKSLKVLPKGLRRGNCSQFQGWGVLLDQENCKSRNLEKNITKPPHNPVQTVHLP